MALKEPTTRSQHESAGVSTSHTFIFFKTFPDLPGPSEFPSCSPFPTLREFVYGWEGNQGFHMGWFDKAAKLSLKNSTRTGYEQIIKAYLIPNFGSKRLNEIDSRQVVDYGNFVYRVWNRAIETSGLRKRTTHDMRH